MESLKIYGQSIIIGSYIDESEGEYMRIAICDDEYEDIQAVLDVVKQYDSSGQHELFCYSKAVDLYQNNSVRAFDIVILDIEMEAPNGYEIAKQLRKESSSPLVIFVTNSMAYTIRGYGVAFRYLTKPLSLDTFSEAMDAAVREVTANRFSFSSDGNTLALQVEEILYFEVYGHFTTVHTYDNQYTIRMTLKDIMAQLPTGYFAAPHQSYIVNLAHIRTATVSEIRLVNGASIPISRRRQRDFEHQFHQYLGR